MDRGAIPENTMLKSPWAPTAAPYADLVQLHADPSHLVILALQTNGPFRGCAGDCERFLLLGAFPSSVPVPGYSN